MLISSERPRLWVLLPTTLTVAGRFHCDRNSAAAASLRITDSPAATVPKPERLTLPGVRALSENDHPARSWLSVPTLVSSTNSEPLYSHSVMRMSAEPAALAPC